MVAALADAASKSRQKIARASVMGRIASGFRGHHNPPMTLHRHLGILRRRCPHIRRAIKEVGLPDPRSIAPGFPAIIHIICTQQVSTAAGETIYQRVVKACGGTVAPKSILKLGEAGL